MFQFIKNHFRKIAKTALVVSVLAGVFFWTNAHNVHFQAPVVITKKGQELAKAQSLEKELEMLRSVVNKQGDWISEVDRELPESLKVSPQGK